MKKRLIAVACSGLLLWACEKDNGKKENAPVPQASVENTAQVEGNSATTPFLISVRLNKTTTVAVTVNFTLLEGTAKAGEDYTVPAVANIVFQPGETEKKITVAVIGDLEREPDETFTLVLTSASNGTVSTKGAIISIINDDTKVPFTDAGYDAPTSYAGYKLVWNDEFAGPALNTANWSNQNGDGCPNVCGWGNNELEYYTDRPENLFFQDGKLVIEARKETMGNKAYTSSKILTQGKKAFKFGRVDIRARMPKGKGLWPALWMLPEKSVFGGWPRSGELDIMEYLGHDQKTVYGTLHYGPGPGSTQINKSFALNSGSFADEFHVFSLEWKQDQIKWLVDGKEYGVANKADFGTNNYPFNEEFFFIINLAVGGNWPGAPDANTIFPQWFIVDYVRVYQQQ